MIYFTPGKVEKLISNEPHGAKNKFKRPNKATLGVLLYPLPLPSFGQKEAFFGDLLQGEGRLNYFWCKFTMQCYLSMFWRNAGHHPGYLLLIIDELFHHLKHELSNMKN